MYSVVIKTAMKKNEDIAGNAHKPILNSVYSEISFSKVLCVYRKLIRKDIF